MSELAPGSGLPDPEGLTVATVGPATCPSPLSDRDLQFVDDDHGVLCSSDTRNLIPYLEAGRIPPAFEEAGPRRLLAFDPAEVTAAMVTCGGLCPGLNDVIRSVTLTLRYGYGVRRILGYRYGYAGLAHPEEFPPARARHGRRHRCARLRRDDPRPRRGARRIPLRWSTRSCATACRSCSASAATGRCAGRPRSRPKRQRRGMRLAVVGIPKTIDNDLDWVERSFGFATAVEAAARTIRRRARRSAWRLERDRPRETDGPSRRLHRRQRHAGPTRREPVPRPGGALHVGRGRRRDRCARGATDSAPPRRRGRRRRRRPGTARSGRGYRRFRQHPPRRRQAHGCGIASSPGSSARGIRPEVKYLDPSYEIRALPANAYDAAFCLSLGQMAAHAGMAGKTDIVVGYHHRHFTHVPIAVTTAQRGASYDPSRTVAARGAVDRPAGTPRRELTPPPFECCRWLNQRFRVLLATRPAVHVGHAPAGRARVVPPHRSGRRRQCSHPDRPAPGSGRAAGSRGR